MAIMLDRYGVEIVCSIQPLLITNNIEGDYQDIIEGLESIEKIIHAVKKLKIACENNLDVIMESIESLSSVEDDVISLICKRILKENETN